MNHNIYSVEAFLPKELASKRSRDPPDYLFAV